MDDIFGELEPLLDSVGNTSCDDAKAGFQIIIYLLRVVQTQAIF